MAALMARPTTYAGIQMRSRLEATVAAHLDDMGVRWTYEPRVFAAHGMEQWLPDFRVELGPVGRPTQVLYLEVKGTLSGREIDGLAADRRRALMTRMAVAWESESTATLVIAEASSWRFDERNPVPGSVWIGHQAAGWSVGLLMQCRLCREVLLIPAIDPKLGVDHPRVRAAGRSLVHACRQRVWDLAHPGFCFVDLTKRAG